MEQEEEGEVGSIAASSCYLQQEAEQVDDVQVDAEGGENIFLWTDGVALVPQQQLSVECKELKPDRERG